MAFCNNDFMPTASESLISIQEAEEVIGNHGGPLASMRTPLMIIIGIVAIILVTLLIMTLLSLRGAKTGLTSVMPFLDNEQSQTLQLN